MLRVLGTLKGKLFGVVLLLALVSALIVVQAWRGLATLNSEIHHIVDVSAKEALLAERIEFNLSRVNGKTFEMLAADHASGAEEISAEIERMIEVVDSNAAELSRIAEAETQEDIAEFLTELKSYEEVTRVVVDRALAGDREGAVALAQSEAAERLHHCEEVLEHVIEVCTASLEHDRDTADAVFMGLRLQMIVFSAIGIAVAGCIALVVVRATVRSIDSVVRRAREISEKDLSGEDLPVRGNDELADLTIAINGMSASLQAIVAEVIVSTSEVSAAATEIAASSEEMSSGLFEQTDQVNQIAAAIEEMAQSITEVASKSAGAADSAELSGRTAASGSETVQQAVERMIAIDEAVTASSRAVAELSRRGEQIGAVITVINDIADQTNLLALNAAIEAARAGEFGRGFAVVADEVRKLADRTTKATDEIAESITAMQSETREAVLRMDRGGEEVQAGVSSVQEAGSSLSKIVQSAQEVCGLVSGIAAAAEEQSAASTQVSQSVQSINAIAQESSEGAKQAAIGATQMSMRAERLRELVAEFRMPG